MALAAEITVPFSSSVCLRHGAGRTRRQVEPDWAWLARELESRPGDQSDGAVEEYRDAHPDGYGYSRFCDLFRGFERRLSPVMRQHHAAGDEVFVDYSGKKVPIVDPVTGVVREAEVFVAVLGASERCRGRPGPRPCPTGLGRTCACSASWMASRAWSFPTI